MQENFAKTPSRPALTADPASRSSTGDGPCSQTRRRESDRCRTCCGETTRKGSAMRASLVCRSRELLGRPPPSFESQLKPAPTRRPRSRHLSGSPTRQTLPLLPPPAIGPGYERRRQAVGRWFLLQWAARAGWPPVPAAGSAYRRPQGCPPGPGHERRGACRPAWPLAVGGAGPYRVQQLLVLLALSSY